MGAYAAKLRDELRKRARVQLFGEVFVTLLVIVDPRGDVLEPGTAAGARHLTVRDLVHPPPMVAGILTLDTSSDPPDSSS